MGIIRAKKLSRSQPRLFQRNTALHSGRQVMAEKIISGKVVGKLLESPESPLGLKPFD